MNWWRRAAMTGGVSNAWFPLGGHNPSVTAHSSISAHPSTQEMEQMAAQHQAQMQAQCNTVTITSTGFGTLAQASSFINPAPAPIIISKSTEATIRSMELLYDWLNPEQRKMLAVRNYFDVVGGDTGRRYRLYPPAPYNIHRLIKDTEETENKICFVPKDQNLPRGDIWLCQKLALELDERATLEIANHQNAGCYGYG